MFYVFLDLGWVGICLAPDLNITRACLCPWVWSVSSMFSQVLSWRVYPWHVFTWYLSEIVWERHIVYLQALGFRGEEEDRGGGRRGSPPGIYRFSIINNLVLKDSCGRGGEGHPNKGFSSSWPWASTRLCTPFTACMSLSLSPVCLSVLSPSLTVVRLPAWSSFPTASFLFHMRLSLEPSSWSLPIPFLNIWLRVCMYACVCEPARTLAHSFVIYPCLVRGNENTETWTWYWCWKTKPKSRR